MTTLAWSTRIAVDAPCNVGSRSERLDRSNGAHVSISWRRVAALMIDLVAPFAVALAVFGPIWAVIRPDRMNGLNGLAIGLGMATAGLTTAIVAFAVHEILVTALRSRTLGEQACGFELELPASRLSQLLRLAGRAAIRALVALAAVASVGLATQYAGEGRLGVLLGLGGWGAIIVLASVVGPDHATTAIDRCCRIVVRDTRATSLAG